MDVLIDLLPSVNQVKIENAKKDKRQRNKYTRQMTSSSSKQSSAKDIEKGTAFKQVFCDRRATRTAISVKI